jgi:hypothetical protein
VLTFDLHNLHLYSEELVKARRAYARYTATIGVLTPAARTADCRDQQRDS